MVQFEENARIFNEHFINKPLIDYVLGSIQRNIKLFIKLIKLNWNYDLRHKEKFIHSRMIAYPYFEEIIHFFFVICNLTKISFLFSVPLYLFLYRDTLFFFQSLICLKFINSYLSWFFCCTFETGGEGWVVGCVVLRQSSSHRINTMQ